jgi:hypothetical protein
MAKVEPPQPAASSVTLVWLEGWYPQAHLYPQDRMRMTFLHSEVLDIRARARQLNKLLNWEEEGTVVEHWIENCSMQKEPSRLALGRSCAKGIESDATRAYMLRPGCYFPVA